MSISLKVVRCAVERCDCKRFSAMRFRRVVIFCRVSRPPSDGADGADAADRSGGAATRSSTSGLLTTPPRPVPVTVLISIPAFSAMRRAAGEDFTPSPDGVGAGAGAGAGALFAGSGGGVGAGAEGAGAEGAGAEGAGAEGAGTEVVAPTAAPTADSSKSASKSPTLTMVPSAAAIFEIAPALGAWTSTVILSVSSSASVSPAATGSPSFFDQRETVASTIDSPSGGTFTWSIQVRA